MSYLDRIYPYKTILLSRQVTRIKKKSTRGLLVIKYQILRTNITTTVWQTVRRYTKEILEVNLENYTVSSNHMESRLNSKAFLQIFRQVMNLNDLLRVNSRQQSKKLPSTNLRWPLFKPQTKISVQQEPN